MKKSFWGYRVGDTDELIESMQNQLDLATTKITTLTMELNSVKEELNIRNNESRSFKQNSAIIADLNQKITNLESMNAILQKNHDSKINDLIIENEALTKKLLKLESTIPAQNDEKYIRTHAVGTICERAYRDMEKMKKEAAEEVKDKVEDFTNVLGDANMNIRFALSDVKEEYNDMIGELTASVQKILDSFQSVERYCKKIEDKILPIDSISTDLKQKIDSLVDISADTAEKAYAPVKPMDCSSEGGEEPVEDAYTAKLEKPKTTIDDEESIRENERTSIWAKRRFEPFRPAPYKEKEEEKEPAINVITNINPKDIFGT